ncbi:MAG TPA: cell envelope integrity protein TolA [Coxiellaceae bacterium]|nr:cell envelope integrity protein TolA [Coxiellaceae bacterium]
MILSASYKKPVFIAVFLHAVLLFFLIVELTPTTFRYPTSSTTPTKIIHVSAISENQVDAQIHAVKAERQRAAEKIIAAERAKQLAILQAEKLKQMRIAQAKKAALLKQQLLTEQKKLQQTLAQQQIDREKKELLKIQTVENQGIIDKYRAEILSLVQSNWRIPVVDDRLKCIYVVNIAPGGVVLSANLIHSSGNTALDQSARAAIMKSSPLPVPDKTAAFNAFRELVLTLSPKGYVSTTT